ncbi:MAG: HupE/UreJ family protein [Gammaproteobacteria bacterium]
MLNGHKVIVNARNRLIPKTSPSRTELPAAPKRDFRHRILVALLLNLMSLPLAAHKSSDSYLTLRITGPAIEGRWDLALRDLDYAIGLDLNEDGAITWGELKTRRAEVNRYALSRLQLAADGTACPVEATGFQVDGHSDGAYAVLRFLAGCSESLGRLDIAYSLLFDLDPQHRGLLQIIHGDRVQTAVLSPAEGSQSFELDRLQRKDAFLQYLHEGMHHIFTGYDHILFLLSLLLPAVFCSVAPRWEAVSRFYPAAIEVTKIVTAFTIAHSITLSLAVLGFLSIPARWVESAIAASVIVAACNNLYPLILKQRWTVAFAFGLVHGLGFANVLKDLGLPQTSLLLALLAFNLGVEIGQLGIVAVFLPATFAVRHSRGYLIFGVRLGSLAIAVIALFWLLERLLNIRLLS